MTQEIRLWKVTEQNTLDEIKSEQINRESDLQKWLEDNISVLDESLLVIGREVENRGYRGRIDLLCIDPDGNLVVIELKRGQSPRETTTQALDYASWVKDLGNEDIKEIASNYLKRKDPPLKDSTLEVVFEEKFEKKLPDVLNSEHRSLIVAESMTAATERIVRYLSEKNVPINVATVQHFKHEGKNLLAQVFLVDPEVAQARAQGTSTGRKGYTTINKLLDIAKESGVGPLCRQLREGVKEFLGSEAYYARQNNIRFHAKNRDGKTRTVMFIDVAPSEQNKVLRFTIHATRFHDLLGISVEELKDLLPKNSYEDTEDVRGLRNSTAEEKAGAVGIKGAFSTGEEVVKFTEGLKKSQAKEG